MTQSPARIAPVTICVRSALIKPAIKIPPDDIVINNMDHQTIFIFTPILIKNKISCNCRYNSEYYNTYYHLLTNIIIHATMPITASIPPTTGNKSSNNISVFIIYSFVFDETK